MDRRGNDDLWVMQTTYIIVGLACWNKYQNMQSTDSFVCQLTVFSGHKEGIMFRFWFPIQIAYFLAVHKIQQAINEQDPPDCAERHEIGLGFGQGQGCGWYLSPLSSNSTPSPSCHLPCSWWATFFCAIKIFLTFAVVTPLSSFAYSE